MSSKDLIIEGARQNNLKNISLSLPHNKVIAITGVSGSGKSSLAFDTIFAEGQWRFLESLSTYARLFIEKLDRPDVDAIYNIRPAIALEQKNPVKGSRSTVGTLTEIYDIFRVIFAHVAKPYCPKCNVEIRRWDVSAIKAHLLKQYLNCRLAVAFKSSLNISTLNNLGYHRFWHDDRFMTSEELADTSYQSITVVVDRLVISDDARLADSLETAWREGDGALIAILFKDNSQIESLLFSRQGCCDYCGYEAKEPSALMFSFNHPLGACPECKGFGYQLVFDEDLLVPDKDKSLAGGAIAIWQGEGYSWWQEQMLRGMEQLGVDVNKPFCKLTEDEKKLLYGGADNFYGINSFFEELHAQKYKFHVRVLLSRLRSPILCPVCEGTRLNSEALIYKIDGKSIADISAMNLKALRQWLSDISLSPKEQELTRDAFGIVRKKLDFLLRVGMGYLSLHRQSKTLSGGEYQRVNLSNQLGSALTGSIYVLDEPTIGLHPRDTQRVIEIMKELARPGNTIIVVEHDLDVIANSDWVVELGPGGGSQGGEVIFAGSSEDFKNSETLTASYLRHKPSIALLSKPFSTSYKLTFVNCTGHNLKGITVNIPLSGLTVVTGVSGSGKSSLVIDTIYQNLAKALKQDTSAEALPCERIIGLEHVYAVNVIDQKPIAKTPRSNLATYLKAFEPIRRLFASQPEAKANGYTAGFFSFNTPGGRCEVCKGEGMQRLEMYFFEDVYARCEACKGRRFKEEALRVKYKGKNIYDVLELTVDDAIVFFRNVPEIVKRLALAKEIGLGYLKLGQSANTFSGGETQRLKICSCLQSTVIHQRKTLYILDEPTVGLHSEDVARLMSVLKKIIVSGSPVIMIEHNLDVIASANWVIDLGPEGGDEGGQVLYEGDVQGLLACEDSYTALHLRRYLRV